MKQQIVLNLSKIKPIDLAYLAGFVDGEGSFGLYDCYYYWHKGRKVPTKAVHLNFQVTNTDKNIISWIKNILGYGFLTKRDPRDDGLQNNKLRYTLSLGSRQNVAEVAGALLPYLKVKKKQAEIILKFYSMHKSRKNPRKEHLLVVKMRKLNRRGNGCGNEFD